MIEAIEAAHRLKINRSGLNMRASGLKKSGNRWKWLQMSGSG